MIKHRDFWQGQRGLNNIKPKRIGLLWESFNAIDLVVDFVGDNTVVEVGCGNGRFSQGFTPEQYVGVDLNVDAINVSRENYPKYQFNILEKYSEIPARDVMLLHSAALYVPDDEIADVFAQAKKRIVLAETMGVRVIKDREQPENLAYHYARTADEYEAILKDWKLVDTINKRDANSGKTFTYMVFEK